MQIFFEEGGGRRRWMNCELISSQMNRHYLLVLLLCFGGELVHSATFTVVNKCPRTIWPGVASNAGSRDPMGTTGFQLAPGSERVLKAPAGWGGRLWARTGCTFDGLGHGNCTTGDCRSNQIECKGAGAAPPVTLAEFQLDGADRKDFYDVSLVNGYNIPMLVEAKGGRGSCMAIGCTADINQTCPNELKLAKGDGCFSACSKFGIPELCCTGQYASSNTCQPTLYSKVFKSACPSAYSYPLDDASSTFTCSGADYTVTFCAVSVPRDSSNNATAPSHTPSTGNSSNNAAPNHAPWTGSATQQSNKKRKVTLAIVLSLVSGILLFSCMGCFLWRRKKNWSGRNFFRDQSNEMDREKDMEIPTFDFSTIAAATDNFSDGNKLGQGGFGPVYKGKLGEEQEVAVKRLSKTSQQGVKEFKNEVLLIAKLQHINLVRLLGCCIQGEEQMLIYEYMVNKSLDAFLFDREKAALLDWKTRYQIITGITRGLLYLHHDSRFRIIHRDLKASNILLDKDMNPKISDFGMARIFGGDETDFNTRKIVGTYGYMSPEYALDGVFSMKSDVFSFGVLVLEIISGKKNRGLYAYDSHLNLVAHAWSLWNEGRSLQLVDESISHSVQMNEVLKCIKIGLLCVQEHAEDRPLMSTVIQMMGSDISSLPQPNKPGFVARNDILEANQYPTKQEPCTNGITVTMLEGR